MSVTISFLKRLTFQYLMVLPYAEELEKLLMELTEEVISTELYTETPIIGSKKLTMYKVLAGEAYLGLLGVTLSCQDNGIDQLESVTYTGIIPGYVDPDTGKEKIDLVANTSPVSEYNKISVPLGTRSVTGILYRHDRHPWPLTPNEVDGLDRITPRIPDPIRYLS